MLRFCCLWAKGLLRVFQEFSEGVMSCGSSHGMQRVPRTSAGVMALPTEEVTPAWVIFHHTSRITWPEELVCAYKGIIAQGQNH